MSKQMKKPAAVKPSVPLNDMLNSLLRVQSTSGECEMMIEFISLELDKLGLDYWFDDSRNLYVTNGKAATYPCVVAHMDTVHEICEEIVPVLIGNNVTGMNPVTMEQTGIGGDDKCGIYAALRLLAELPECKAAFFVDEEVGCQGSYGCNINFFADCRFVLQADRRGNSDWVEKISGSLGSKRFQKDVRPIIESHGYSPCSGMMSDVMALRDMDVGVSVANMSAGYYEPHMRCEYINLWDLENVVNMMLAICRELPDRYEFIMPKEEIKRSYLGSTTSFRGYYDSIVTTKDGLKETNNGSRHVSKSETDRFPDYAPSRPDFDDEEYCACCYDKLPAINMIEDGMGNFLCYACDRSLKIASK